MASRAWQALGALRAVACTDLTTLSGDDTPGNVARLCAKAANPVRAETLAALGLDRVKNRLAADTAQPLSIDRVDEDALFPFEDRTKLEPQQHIRSPSSHSNGCLISLGFLRSSNHRTERSPGFGPTRRAREGA